MDALKIVTKNKSIRNMKLKLFFFRQKKMKLSFLFLAN